MYCIHVFYFKLNGYQESHQKLQKFLITKHHQHSISQSTLQRFVNENKGKHDE